MSGREGRGGGKRTPRNGSEALDAPVAAGAGYECDSKRLGHGSHWVQDARRWSETRSRLLRIGDAMPIHWTISHEERLVMATTEGVVTLKDIEAYLDALVVADPAPYAKLFNATDVDLQATDHDVMMLGARMRHYLATGPRAARALLGTKLLARDCC